ncbi:MAG: rubredoxin [Clostridia bacterium]|nr:rubredoxin [Clostridia bacterium]
MIYMCNVCGFEYDESLGCNERGIVAGTLWCDVPDTFTCPICGVDKEQFMIES